MIPKKKTSQYYVVFNPLIFNLMDKVNEQDVNVLDLISYITNLNGNLLNETNFLKYLKFDLQKEKIGMVENLGIENYGSYYIANQISNIDKESQVILSDGKRRTICDIIKQKEKKPEAIFITSLSANFPIAVLSSIILNHGKIPVIIGGIHVSSSPEDVDTYIKSNVPNPELVTFVKGAGDSAVIKEILSDLKNKTVKPEYFGNKTIEDRVWGNENVVELPVMKNKFLLKFPVLGRILVKHIKSNVTTPYLGCPYSCKFCSISSMPANQRKFISRSSEDFINELLHNQKDGATFANRFYMFLPDNLLLGGKRLEEMLDKIIESKLELNYMAQISIESASNEKLLEKLRLSGASHFFIGFESLNLKNLKYVNKHIINEIEKSKLSVPEFYSKKIQLMQNYGFSIHGAFMFGMPYDYFNSMDDHTGKDITEFCIENKIGLQPSCFNDLPGSSNFQQSQIDGIYKYGPQGTIKYLISLCTADLLESNRELPDSLMNSPLVVSYMVYETIKKVGSYTNAINLSYFMAKKAWKNPTKNGNLNLMQKVYDAFAAIGFQLGSSTYFDLYNSVAYSKNGIKGFFERIYESEKNPEIKSIFEDYVRQFY